MTKLISHPATLVDPMRLNQIFNNKLDYTKDPLKSARAKILQEAPLNYSPRSLEVVSIGFGGTGQGHNEFTGDGKMCYAQTLAYLITKNETYANNCMSILDAWATKCKQFTGENAILEASWGTAVMARSCEILKHFYPKWNKDIEKRYISWVQKLLMPHLKCETEKYKLNWGFHNNWHTSNTEARLQFALLTNNTTEVDWCVNQYKTILSSYVYKTGFTYETLRDSDHCCFGIAGMIHICEILYHQGINVYNLNDNSLLRCVELHARIYGDNFTPPNYARDQFNVCKWIQPSGWEIVLNHFGESNLPFTKKLLSKIRPCGFALHWGYDTLTHATTTEFN